MLIVGQTNCCNSFSGISIVLTNLADTITVKIETFAKQLLNE